MERNYIMLWCWLKIVSLNTTNLTELQSPPQAPPKPQGTKTSGPFQADRIMAQRETKTQCRGELGEAKASDRKGSMNFAVLGSMFDFRAFCSTTVSLPAASRHRPIAFASEGSPRKHRQSLNNPG